MGRNRWLLLLGLLIGVGIRLAMHDLHGLEGDDAFSLAISRTPLADLIPGLMRLQLDVHPPLHFLLLKAWTALAGDSLLALRMLNILLDVLTGALMIRITENNAAAKTAVLALWAFSPLLIFAGWLVRMYTLLAFLTMATAACVMLFVQRTSWLIGAAVCSLLAMYTHFLGVIVFGAAALICTVISLGNMKRFATSVSVFTLVGVLYLPFAVNALQFTQQVDTLGAEVNPAFDGTLTLWQQAGLIVWQAFFHRVGVPNGVLPLVAGVFVLVIGFALSLQVADGKNAVPTVRILPIFALLTFIGITLMVWRIGLKPRYVVPFAPLWIVFLASVWGRRWWAQLPNLALITVMVWGLTLNTRYSWRDDWLAATDFMETYTVSGDAVLVVPDWGQEAMRYHYAGDAPVRGFFPQITPELNLGAAFGDYVRDYERVWLVRYQPDVSDPDALALAWLNERGATVTTIFPAGMEITLFEREPIDPSLPASARPLDVQFGDILALRGVTLPDSLTMEAVNKRLYDESGRVLVALHWEALRPDVTEMPRARLTDTFGQVYGGTLDNPNSVLARHPVSTWQPGEVVTLYYDINLNPTTPPGIYNIEVMVLDANGQPITTSGGDAGEFWAVAGQVSVR